MTTLQEALDKLGKYQKSLVEIRDDLAFSKRFAIDEIGRSIEVIKAALEQHGEPVAEVVHVKQSGFPEVEWLFGEIKPTVGMLLYTVAPPPRQDKP